ncbi:olpB [Symbiodinium natans]|uniref:OlpB protein n=1 Tax=Symbiodinium natans TaxID=878477 RepID=A0A812Q1E7_9DINO|nr:olpB [Symbiodinium natans]
MASWLSVLLGAAVLTTGQSCRCVPDYIPQDEAFASPAQALSKEPFVFAGKVISVRPADNMPEAKSEYCALPPKLTGESDHWGNPCQESFSGYFEHWNECGRIHTAEVLVTHGLKGIKAGETFKYNCTRASCGDCSPPCPEVGHELLDGTRAGGPSSMCSSKRCGLRASSKARCQHLLEELQLERPFQSQRFQVPLPVAFSTLTANSFFRSQLLGSLVRDVSSALQLSEFDAMSANLLEDQHRTVPVMPAATVPSSIFELIFHMPRQEDLDAVESQLRDLLSKPFIWKGGSEVVKQFCLSQPCPQCQTTCVEPSLTSLVSLGSPIFA